MTALTHVSDARKSIETVVADVVAGPASSCGYDVGTVSFRDTVEVIFRKGDTAFALWVRPLSDASSSYRQTSRLKIGHSPDPPDHLGYALMDAVCAGIEAWERSIGDEELHGLFEPRSVSRSGAAANGSHPSTGTRPSRGVAFWRESQLGRRLLVAGPLTGRTLTEAVHTIFDEDLPAGIPGEIHLYFESACAQSCEFCVEPHVRSSLAGRVLYGVTDGRYRIGLDLIRRGVVGLILDEAARRTPPVSIVITGHDWARSPALEELLQELESRRTGSVSFLGPSTRLADPTLAARVAAVPGLDTISLTLQSSDPEVHDEIVGAMGSNRDVVAAIENLQALGVAPRVVVVLTARAMPTLPGTLEWIADHGLRVTLNAFIPDRFAGWDPGALMPSSQELRRSLEAARDSLIAAKANIIGVPLCLVPEELRHSVVRASPSKEREAVGYPEVCATCSLRQECSGVPWSYLHRHGQSGFEPVTAEPVRDRVG